MEFNGTAVKLLYSGKLAGEGLAMKMQREGAPRSVEFTLKKSGD
jgi:hypothetical protein